MSGSAYPVEVRVGFNMPLLYAAERANKSDDHHGTGTGSPDPTARLQEYVQTTGQPGHQRQHLKHLRQTFQAPITRPAAQRAAREKPRPTRGNRAVTFTFLHRYVDVFGPQQRAASEQNHKLT